MYQSDFLNVSNKFVLMTLQKLATFSFSDSTSLFKQSHPDLRAFLEVNI